MLIGHVDAVSAERVAGWAFDGEFPDRRVEVSIFVDQQKVGQVTCDRDRADLRQKGRHGDGKHGFLFQFDAPLASEVERTVTVRHSHSGEDLGNGRCVLFKGDVKHVPTPQPPRPEQLMRLPCPINPRQLLEIFALYDGSRELYDLLTRVDFPKHNARDAYYCVFGRYPDGSAPLSKEDASIPDFVNRMLLSEEFQQNIISIFLNAYQEKRRLLFVHIPKCAGSDLSNHLVTKYPSIGQMHGATAWTSWKELFACLRDIVLRTKFSNSIFVRGHLNLAYYLSSKLVRPGDEIFTVIRDPHEIAISHINYILTRFSVDFKRQSTGPDTGQWLSQLGLPNIPDTSSSEANRALAQRILYNPQIVPSNPLCHWLGGGTAETVLARMAVHGVEISDTTRYSAWLNRKWELVGNTRQNASRAFISPQSLDQGDVDYIRGQFAEDIKLYHVVHEHLTRYGLDSVRANEISREASL
jgi:hypothetical protein